MKLFLCSSFITQTTQKDFETLIGKPMKGLRIACITTASKGYLKLCEEKGEKADMSWLVNEIKSAKEDFGCIVDSFDIEEIPQSQMIDAFKKYDTIWVEGGLTFYLMRAVIHTGFDVVLKELLKGNVYIGTSAGSMICSKSLDASEWYIGDPKPNKENLQGLGLIDFQIYPHFDEKDLDSIKQARHVDQEYWLLKNGQAVAVSDKAVKICGGDIVKLESER